MDSTGLVPGPKPIFRIGRGGFYWTCPRPQTNFAGSPWMHRIVRGGFDWTCPRPQEELGLANSSTSCVFFWHVKHVTPSCSGSADIQKIDPKIRFGQFSPPKRGPPKLNVLWQRRSCCHEPGADNALTSVWQDHHMMHGIVYGVDSTGLVPGPDKNWVFANSKNNFCFFLGS